MNKLPFIIIYFQNYLLDKYFRETLQSQTSFQIGLSLSLSHFWGWGWLGWVGEDQLRKGLSLNYIQSLNLKTDIVYSMVYHAFSFILRISCTVLRCKQWSFGKYHRWRVADWSMSYSSTGSFFSCDNKMNGEVVGSRFIGCVTLSKRKKKERGKLIERSTQSFGEILSCTMLRGLKTTLSSCSISVFQCARFAVLFFVFCASLSVFVYSGPC